jgi:hypothetical protein
MVKMLLEDCSKVGEFPADDLEFAKEVIAKLRGHDSITEAADRTIASIDGVLPTKRKSEAIELVDFINGFRRE